MPGRATKTKHWCDLSAHLANHTPKCTPGLPLLERVERAARIQLSTNLASKNARTGRAWMSRIIEGQGTIGRPAPSMDCPLCLRSRFPNSAYGENEVPTAAYLVRGGLPAAGQLGSGAGAQTYLCSYTSQGPCPTPAPVDEFGAPLF
jgi:hypothetical protein